MFILYGNTHSPLIPTSQLSGFEWFLLIIDNDVISLSRIEVHLSDLCPCTLRSSILPSWPLLTNSVHKPACSVVSSTQYFIAVERYKNREMILRIALHTLHSLLTNPNIPKRPSRHQPRVEGKKKDQYRTETTKPPATLPNQSHHHVPLTNGPTMRVHMT